MGGFKRSPKIMNLIEDSQIKEVKARLIEGMVDFMDEDTEYNQTHIDSCEKLLTAYLEGASGVDSKDALMSKVELTVVALNELNESVDHELIETDQREDICAIIIRAGALRGFNGENDDITEDWRDW